MTEFSDRAQRQVGAELVEHFRTLKLRGGNMNPVDFDGAGDMSRYLTPGAKRKIVDIREKNDDAEVRQETLYQISCLEDRFDVSTPDGEFGIKQIRAVVTWAEALGRIRHTPYVQEIVEELGLDPQSLFVLTEVPDEIIEAQSKIVAKVFYDCGYEFSRRGLQRYRRDHVIKIRYGDEEIKKTFGEAKERLVPKMRDALGLTYIPSVDMEFVKEDKYFKVWVRGDVGNSQMKINTHKRHEGKWNPGQIGRLVVHEYEHLFEAEELAKRVENDELNPIHGITTVPGPYQWRAEAFADSFTRFFPIIYDNMTIFERAAVQYEILKNEVLRNVSLRANLKQEPRKKVSNYVHHYLPGDSHRDIKLYVDDRIDNLQFRAYFLSYGGVKEMCDYAEMFDSDSLDSKRENFARSFLERQMSPAEVLNKFREFEDYTSSPTRVPFSRKLVGISDAAYEGFRRIMVGKQDNKPLYFRHGFGKFTERTA